LDRELDGRTLQTFFRAINEEKITIEHLDEVLKVTQRAKTKSIFTDAETTVELAKGLRNGEITVDDLPNLVDNSYSFQRADGTMDFDLFRRTMDAELRDLISNLNIVEDGPRRISLVDPGTNKRVGTLSYGVDSSDPNHIVTITTDVDSNLWGNGLQNRMFDRLLIDSDFNRITTSLIATNEDAFATAFVANMELRYPISSFSPNDFPANQIADCCRDLIRNLPQEELDEIVRESIKNTPAYKSRRRFGFETCDHKFVLDEPTGSLEVGFTACR